MNFSCVHHFCVGLTNPIYNTGALGFQMSIESYRCIDRLVDIIVFRSKGVPIGAFDLPINNLDTRQFSEVDKQRYGDFKEGVLSFDGTKCTFKTSDTVFGCRVSTASIQKLSEVTPNPTCSLARNNMADGDARRYFILIVNDTPIEITEMFKQSEIAQIGDRVTARTPGK